MTALQVAKVECANCDSAGHCAGVGIADDLSSYVFRQPGKCYLAEQPIKRCVYFEQCVAPLAKARLREATTQEQKPAAGSLAEGVREYEMAVMPGPTVKFAKCKSCHRRVHVPKRLCEQCARNNTLRSKRQYWVRTRKNGASGALVTKDL
jgi:hypothetical protein